MEERSNEDEKSVNQPKNFLIRLFREDDIDKILELRSNFGVHVPYSAVRTWFKVDPESILVAENESGEIIGTGSAVKQTEDLYFLGLFYVHEECRNLGIGYKIVQLCLKRIGTADLALNARPGSKEFLLNKESFLTSETEFHCIAYSSTKPVDSRNLSDHLPQDVTFESFNVVHLPQVFAYDSALVGYNREHAVALSCQEEDSRTLVALKNNVCVGYGSIKKTTLGAGRVGPLYADDPFVAEVLLRNLILSMTDVTGLMMIVLCTNSTAQEWLRNVGCTQEYNLSRLYKGKRMVANTSKVFAIFDPSFTLF